jgi:hypothetical protein
VFGNQENLEKIGKISNNSNNSPEMNKDTKRESVNSMN